jgi:hypothetical protein
LARSASRNRSERCLALISLSSDMTGRCQMCVGGASDLTYPFTLRIGPHLRYRLL